MFTNSDQEWLLYQKVVNCHRKSYESDLIHVRSCKRLALSLKQDTYIFL